MPSPLILLIDDDRSLVTLLEGRLRREGYGVTTSVDAAQAEEQLQEHQFDVILLDVMLPDRSGFDFCAELRDRGVETPILMPTARGAVADRVTGLRIGADDYLPKPFEVPELLARIESLRRRAGGNRGEEKAFSISATSPSTSARKPFLAVTHRWNSRDASFRC
jgi:DNA-binding response OmpR family regulator